MNIEGFREKSARMNDEIETLRRQLAEKDKEIERLRGDLYESNNHKIYAQQHNAHLERQLAEKDAEIKQIKDDKEGLVCGDCDGSGWLENKVEGKFPCTCMTEAEPYQLLEQQLAESRAREVKLLEALSTRIWRPIEEATIDEPIISYCRKYGVLDGTKQWLMQPIHGRGKWTPSHYIPYPTSTAVDGDTNILTMPTDDTALREMIAKAGEVMREGCDSKVTTMRLAYHREDCSLYAGNVAEAIRTLPGVTLEDLK